MTRAGQRPGSGNAVPATLPGIDAAEAANRVARFETTLDPGVLWPEVDERSFRTAMREVVRAASAVLTTPDGPPGELSESIAQDTAAFGAAAFASGLGPLLGYWIEAGRLESPPGAAGILREHLDQGRRRAERLRGELEELVRVFRRTGIDVTVLKGMHTGWEYFPDPGTRPASDIDLLIPPGTVAEAADALRRVGFVRRHGTAERSVWRPPGPSRVQSVRLTHVENPWELDLHETLDRRFPSAPRAAFGPLEASDRRAWQVGRERVWTLTQPLLTCFLAVHAASHLPHLQPLRMVELVLVLRRDLGGTSSWQAVAHRFGRTHTGAYAYPTLKLVEDLVPGTIESSLLDTLHAAAPPAVHRLLSRLTPATALQMYHRTLEGPFLWVSGWRRWVAIATCVWPEAGNGGRVPLREAMAVTGSRVRRLLRGRYRRRAR